MGLILLKFIVIVFTIFWFISFTEDEPWIFPKAKRFGDAMDKLEEYEPLFATMLSWLLMPFTVIWALLPIFLINWVWSL